MRLFITTLGRVESQRTLKNLSPTLRERTSLVVQEHEFSQYSARWQDSVRSVIGLPPEIRTLGPTRRMMHEMARRDGLPYYCLLDDDLDFYIRRDPTDWRLSTPTDEELEGMFDQVEVKLQQGYMHVGVSGREGNNRVMDYGVECTRYMRLLAYRTDMPDECIAGRVDGMSDFDLNLQLLRRGLPSYVFYRYAQGQPGTQSPGGCSLNRNLESHEREIDKMVAWHAPHVRKRWKENKTGGEFGSRPEVTISWKRAYQEGLTRV